MQSSTVKKMLPFICLGLIVIAVVLGIVFGGVNYALISIIIVLLSFVPFLFVFEKKKPKARELVPLAVMAAIATVGRAAFAPIPQFKPIVAIVIIAGLSFGAEAGFFTGAVSILVSNFIFGQGPWTPWQMLACGLIGFIAGSISKRGGLKATWSICLFGFVSGFVYGLIVDVWTVLGFISPITWQGILAIYGAGFVFNLVLAVATAIFLFLLAKPMTRKLSRIRRKFGLMDTGETPLESMQKLNS